MGQVSDLPRPVTGAADLPMDCVGSVNCRKRGLMLGGLGKSVLLRLGSYALFLCGFWLLYQAFERSSIGLGIGGGAAILAAMWAMVGFRRPPSARSERKPDEGQSEFRTGSKQ